MAKGNAYLFIASLALMVSACHQSMVWNKPGASQAAFNTDRYRCMQESQQQSSSAYINRYAGYASSGQTTNDALFQACMNASGWSLQKDVSADAKGPSRDQFDSTGRKAALTTMSPQLCSCGVMVSKDAVRRVGIERCQSRIEAEPRPAIGTGDSVRLAHIDVDVRVVVRWGHADALELLHPDADFRDTAVVPELRIAAAGHQLE